jgi:FkbM family methyltransferase
VLEGDTVFGIGANIGRFTPSAARVVGKNGNVYCFEPLSYALRMLRHMVFIERLHQVVILDPAISNENGQSIMTTPLKDNRKPKTSLAYLGKKRDNEDKVKREEVKLITLDDF